MSPPAIGSVADLLAHAYAIEAEAEERYRDLAVQMEVHNNPELAALFNKLAELEGRHAEEIRARAGELPHIAPWDYAWTDAESPETVGLQDVHYKMTPYHALTAALAAEQRALEFFERISETEEPEVRKLALEMAADEREHVRIVREELAKYPEPEAGWDEDPDPPALQE